MAGIIDQKMWVRLGQASACMIVWSVFLMLVLLMLSLTSVEAIKSERANPPRNCSGVRLDLILLSELQRIGATLQISFSPVGPI